MAFYPGRFAALRLPAFVPLVLAAIFNWPLLSALAFGWYLACVACELLAWKAVR